MQRGPQVSIIMGSDSDLSVMAEAARALDQLGVSNDVLVASAHRTPHRVMEFASTAEERGVQVIIAGAGGAAHLPGVVAALTILPVIGVPCAGKHLAGADSLYSIVQMPAGIPVATVGINQARNAGLLAAQIIAVGDPALRQRLHEARAKMADEIAAKQQKLEHLGVSGYLEDQKGGKS